MKLIAAVVVSCMLVSCGGGGKSSVCADFQYQQDAQSAYRAGATELDRDNDGIACEELPSRTSPAGTPSSTQPPRPPYSIMTGTGTLIKLYPTLNAYTVEYDEHGNSGTGAATPVPLASGFGSEIASSGLTLRYVKSSDSTLVTWSPASNGYPATTGVGAESTVPTLIGEIVGKYKLIGQQCSPLTKVCGLVVGTAAIAADGTFTLCVGGEHSNSCPGIDTRALVRASSSATATNAWSIGVGGENLIASKDRGTVAFSYTDRRFNASGQRNSTDIFTFFGQLDGVTGLEAIGQTSMVGFNASGQVQADVPRESQWGVTLGKPLSGFFQDASGNTYLQSKTGQLVSWTVGSGLRTYSKP